MARTEHVFVAGVRLDTEIQYLGQSNTALKYHKLPVLQSPSPQSSTFSALLQSVLIVGRVPHSHLTRKHQAPAQDLLASSTSLDVDRILGCIHALGDASSVSIIALEQTGCLTDVGNVALELLRSGGVGLLHFESATATRWAVVIGVEVEVNEDRSIVRTLLLLDSQAAQPWATAHNVRLQLLPEGRRSKAAAGSFPLICRHLTGEFTKVRILSLVSLHRATAG